MISTSGVQDRGFLRRYATYFVVAVVENGESKPRLPSCPCAGKKEESRLVRFFKLPAQQQNLFTFVMSDQVKYLGNSKRLD